MRMSAAVAYFAEEPVGLEGPENWVGVEHEGVRVRSVVACKEAHFFQLKL